MNINMQNEKEPFPRFGALKLHIYLAENAGASAPHWWHFSLFRRDYMIMLKAQWEWPRCG